MEGTCRIHWTIRSIALIAFVLAPLGELSAQLQWETLSRWPEIPIGTGYIAEHTTTGDPVFPVNGEVRIEKADLAVPSVGFPFAFVRTYRSGTNYDGPLGHRWDFNFNARLVPNTDPFQSTPDTIASYDGSGFIRSYSYSSSTGDWRCNGINDKITWANSKFTRRTKDGFKFVYAVCSNSTTSWRLDKMEDRNGNYQSFGYSATTTSGRLNQVVDTNGRTYAVSYLSSGRIDEISDFGTSPRKIKYEYSSGGDLIRVRELSTESGLERSTTYSYATSGAYSHLVATITDPKQNVEAVPVPFVRNYYDSNGKCIAQEYGAGAETDDGQNSPSNAYTWNYGSGVTTFTDRSGTQIKFYFDTAGICTKKEWQHGTPMPAIQYWYDSKGNLTKLEKNNGSRLHYTYDTESNLTASSSTDSSDANALTWSYEYESTFNQVTRAVDPSGLISTFEYDSAGNLTKSIVDQGSGSGFLNLTSEFHYDSANHGLMDWSKDPRGIKTTYQYTSDDYLWKVTEDADTGGLAVTSVEYGYDQFGNVTSAKDSLGRTTTMTVNRLNQVTKVTSPSPLAYETEYFYDPSDNLTKLCVENSGGKGTSGYVVDTYYDILDNVTKVVEDVAGTTRRTTEYFYDVEDKLTRVKAPEGNEVHYQYDVYDLNTGVTVGYGTSGAATTKYYYDADFRLTKTEQPLGASWKTEYFYDHHDRLTKTKNAAGHYVLSSFGGDHLVDSVSTYKSDDTLLTQVKTYYDSANRVTKTEAMAKDDVGTDIGDGWLTSKVEYDAAGRVTKRLDENDHATLYTYDNLDRLTRIEDPVANRVTYAFDTNGNLLTLTQAETGNGGSSYTSYASTFEYDALGRLTKSKDPLLKETTFSYDPRGNVTQVQDPNENKVFSEYDELNRKTKLLVEYSGTNTLTTRWEYDKNDRLTKVYDGKSQATSFAYDALDRQVSTTYADSGVVTWAYDVNSNVTERVDQNATTVTYSYNTLNLLTKKEFEVTAAHIKGETTQKDFWYDPLNRLTKAEDTDSRVLYKYNTLGLVESEEMHYGTINKTASAGRKVEWDYDDQGRATAIRYPSATSTNGQLNYSYDNANRLTRIRRQTGASTQEDLVDWEFSGPGRISKKSYGNGTHCVATFDGRGLISTLIHRKTADESKRIVEFAYQYDDAGRMTAEKVIHYKNDGTTVLEDKGFNFEYDKASRLTRVYREVPSADIGTFPPTNYSIRATYTFDGASNRVSVENKPKTGTTTTDTYTSNNTNAYTDVWWAGSQETYDYDPAGSRTSWSGGVKTWCYDYQNKLVEVRESGEEFAEYDHDVLGRRIAKRYWYNSLELDYNVEKRFYYAGSALIQEYDLSGTDGAVSAEAKDMEYFWGQSTSEPCQERKYDLLTGSLELTGYYHQNVAASVYAITSTASGAPLVETYRHDEYGRVTVFGGDGTASTMPYGNRLGWRCRYEDTEIAAMVGAITLAYDGARSYDPETASGLTRDQTRPVLGSSPNPLRSGDSSASMGIAPEIYSGSSGSLGSVGERQGPPTRPESLPCQRIDEIAVGQVLPPYRGGFGSFGGWGGGFGCGGGGSAMGICENPSSLAWWFDESRPWIYRGGGLPPYPGGGEWVELGGGLGVFLPYESSPLPSWFYRWQSSGGVRMPPELYGLLPFLWEEQLRELCRWARHNISEGDLEDWFGYGFGVQLTDEQLAILCDLSMMEAERGHQGGASSDPLGTALGLAAWIPGPWGGAAGIGEIGYAVSRGEMTATQGAFVGTLTAVGGKLFGKLGRWVLRKFGLRAAQVVDANKLHHIFRPGHNLDDLVRASGGSTAEAFGAVQRAANAALKDGLLSPGANGVLPGRGAGAIINVNGVRIQMIGGRVANGMVQIATFIGL